MKSVEFLKRIQSQIKTKSISFNDALNKVKTVLNLLNVEDEEINFYFKEYEDVKSLIKEINNIKDCLKNKRNENELLETCLNLSKSDFDNIAKSFPFEI